LVQLRGTNPDQKSPTSVPLPANAISTKDWRAAERRVEAWISECRGGRVASFQREAWRAWGTRESGLIHAPTGSGKTIAALGGPMIEAIARGAQANEGLSILWVTPLRALAADLIVQLEAPLHDLGIPWRVLRRTGDSGSGERTKLKAGRVEVLVTTPESLALQLSYEEAGSRFKTLSSIVVDEWHELLGSKRGVLFELGLARLRRIAPDARIWGLSATIGNLEEAMRALLGPGRPGRLIAVRGSRPMVIETALPPLIERFAWAGHLGLSQLPRVVEAAGAARSVLVFTNTRSQAELWLEAIASVWPHAPETLAIHHGSLDRGLRRKVEDGLRSGAVRCVVATSSLDLGVDFASVDAVIQIGSARGIARLLQRAGRSNHRPGEAGRILCVPTHSLELAEIAAARRALAAGAIEPRPPLTGGPDVLAQHLTTLALAGGFVADAAFTEIRLTHAYAALDRSMFDAVLAFLVHGGALHAYPDYRRLIEHHGQYILADPLLARRHRFNIGTIVAHGAVEVRFLRGGRLGQIEEAFAARLKPGDRFLFAGRHLEFVRTRDMTVWVKLTRGSRTAVPRWMGGRLSLSNELGQWLRRTLSDDKASEPEMQSLKPLLALQRQKSQIPAPHELLIEIVRARDGEHLFVFPFAGRLVHEGLGALLALRLGRMAPVTLTFGANDYGVVVSGQQLPFIDLGSLRAFFDPGSLREDVIECIGATELAKRQFREIARIAGLVFDDYPGRDKSLRNLQASAGLIYDVLTRYDPHHILLQQALDEVCEQTFNFARLQATLEEMKARDLILQRPAALTPFSFPLWSEWVRGGLSSEDWGTRVQRLAEQLEKQAR
jgi:ATP-dependent helicase Lhr and Lhr-like helicase